MNLSSLTGSRAVRRIAAFAAPILLAIVLAVVYSYIGGSNKSATGGRTDTAAAATISAKEVNALFAQLKVAAEGPMTGYSRDEFPTWDHNTPEHGFGDKFAQYSKCTTREVMMLRDATGPVTLDASSCKITVGKGGGWQDHYGVLDSKTGKLEPYKFITEAKGVDAEHIMPLAEAWRSGAKDIGVDARRNIANDAINLVASDPSANRSKGDQDLAHYIPPGNFHCEYVQRYIRMKAKYNLTIDPGEQKAIRAAVDDCQHKGEFT